MEPKPNHPPSSSVRLLAHACHRPESLGPLPPKLTRLGSSSQEGPSRSSKKSLEEALLTFSHLLTRLRRYLDYLDSHINAPGGQSESVPASKVDCYRVISSHIPEDLNRAVASLATSQDVQPFKYDVGEKLLKLTEQEKQEDKPLDAAEQALQECQKDLEKVWRWKEAWDVPKPADFESTLDNVLESLAYILPKARSAAIAGLKATKPATAADDVDEEEEQEEDPISGEDIVRDVVDGELEAEEESLTLG